MNVINIQEGNNLTLELLKDPTLEVEVNHVRIENEVSTFDLSFEHETQGENYYDASYELQDLDFQGTPKKKDNPIIFRTREGKEIELPQYPTTKQKQTWERKKEKLKKIQQTLKAPPTMQGKQEYLRMVKANVDCQKNKVIDCYRAKLVMETKGNPKKKSHDQNKENKAAKQQILSTT